MARHRDIRNMDFNEEYDGYHDVYGHSVDDDFYISPSNRQFLFNRDNSRNQTKIGEFIRTGQDIDEEDDLDTSLDLSDEEKDKLRLCLGQIRSEIGDDLNISREELINHVISHNFNVQETIDSILKQNDIRTSDKSVPIAPTLKFPNESETQTPVTVVSSGKTTNVIKGFDLSKKLPQTQSSSNKLSVTPRAQSPISGASSAASSGQATPIVSVPSATPIVATTNVLDDIKNNKKKVDVEQLYKTERGNQKEHLFMVVVGHVDAGKSTLMGHFLCALGQVNQRTMHKYEQESRKLGKQSFMYAWVLDETGEERNRGITMDIGRSQFETKTKQVTLLDAPGHRDFIPNMISGAGQADVAVLVVDATRGEFETGFDHGGQTREHALLVRSLGVTQLAVVINKLDTVSWSQERFDEIVQKMKPFLKQVGFKEKDITFVPCSGLTGQNLVHKPTENELLTWYDGPNLLEVIDNFKTPERPISKPFRLSVYDTFKGTGTGGWISGKVESGSVSVGDRILLCPSKEIFQVKSLFVDDCSKQTIFAGDEATIVLIGGDTQNISVGNILCDPCNPIPIASKFQARVVIFNSNVPVTKGFSVVLHCNNLAEPAVISKLLSQIDKSTGKLLKKHPRYLNNNSSAIIEIQVSKPIALELYSDCKELGRIMLRVGGVTIAAGLITKILQQAN